LSTRAKKPAPNTEGFDEVGFSGSADYLEDYFIPFFDNDDVLHREKGLQPVGWWIFGGR
jgi:hypothetical protein